MWRILFASMILFCLCMAHAWTNDTLVHASSIEVFVDGHKYSSIGEYKQAQKEAVLNNSLDVIVREKEEPSEVEVSIIDQAVKNKEITVVNGIAHETRAENKLSEMKSMLSALKKKNQKYDSIVIDESKMKTITIP